MSPRLDQLVATVAPRDAVTTQALEWRALLARHGIAGEIYAENVHDALRDEVQPLDRFRGEYATLMRYSIWSGAGERFMALDGGTPQVLLYHNITPSHMLGESPVVAALCDEGRRALPRMVAAADVTVADSAFNAAELASVGARETHVVPLLLDLPTTPAPQTPATPRVVVVGRVAPSKRIDAVVRTAVLLQRRIPDAHIDVIGSWEGFERHHGVLRTLIDRLDADRAVTLHGQVDDATRDRMYAQAGAYLTLSAHEGFCAPLLEALAAGLPVVAADTAAIPDTLAGAGILVPDGDPVFAAETLRLVVSDPQVRATLHERAVRRLAHPTRAEVEQQIVELVRGVLA